MVYFYGSQRLDCTAFGTNRKRLGDFLLVLKSR